jgi:hypothetical protein
MTGTIRNQRTTASRAARAEGARLEALRAQRRRRLTMAGVAAAVVSVLGVVVVAVASSNGDSGNGRGVAGPRVGGDLHALAVAEGAMYVSGHGGAGKSTDGGRSWQQLDSLADKDGMGWAVSGAEVLVGGHGGLYRSVDGTSFTAVTGLPVSDVHGLGGAGKVLYLASPQGGVYVSQDGGQNWAERGSAGAGIMGTILVDPADTDKLIAPDMGAGVVASRDGGRSWKRLGGPSGAMSVARNPVDTRELVAVGMGGSQHSTDGGNSWVAMMTPAGVNSVAFDLAKPTRMVAAALSGDRAAIYLSDDSGATWNRADQG